jgi:type II secretory pathway component PulK
MKRRPLRQRRGFLLVIVLIVVMVLALGAYAFSELMLSHREATQLSGRQSQCRLSVDSGVENVRLFLAQNKDSQRQSGGLYNNPEVFRGALVVDDPEAQFRSRFTVIAPAVDQEGNLGGVRYGVENESTRLNINSLLMIDKQSPGAARQLLMALPNCTPDIADAILDFMDKDSDTREYGAEADYYSGLTPPYAPKNGQFDTVEELLLVRGITPQLLFGLDINRNGVVDSFEDTGGPTTVTTSTETASLSSLTSGGTGETITIEADMSRGWSAYLTLYSMERNVNSQGQPRVHVNMPNMAQLYQQLTAVMPEDWATYIVAYKQFGPFTGTQVNMNTVRGQKGGLNLQVQSKVNLAQVIDLIGTKTQVTLQGSTTPVILESPFAADPIAMNVYLPVLMDNCTVSQSPIIPGRININQAPKAVLAGIPGMTEDILNQIINVREFEAPDDKPNRRFETWIMAEAIVDPATMKLLMPFITCGGDVHRAQVVGYYEGGTASARAEVVFDATAANPRVLFWRDLSHLGRGFALETLGIELTETP